MDKILIVVGIVLIIVAVAIVVIDKIRTKKLIDSLTRMLDDAILVKLRLTICKSKKKLLLLPKFLQKSEGSNVYQAEY